MRTNSFQQWDDSHDSADVIDYNRTETPESARLFVAAMLFISVFFLGLVFSVRYWAFLMQAGH